MFINYTNHPSDKWSARQYDEACKYGVIYDMPFPDINPGMDKESIIKMADCESVRIADNEPECVLCQGEFVLTYHLVSKLKEMGIKVVAACNERRSSEKYENGKSVKTTIFEFVQFREY